MTKAQLFTETKRYALCPDCSGRLGSVDHLLGSTTRTAWHCDDCGKRWGLLFQLDGSLELEPMGDAPLVHKLIVLEMPPQASPVTVVLRVKTAAGHTDANREYFYNEHTCPTNWLGDVEVISINGNHDPHGLFEFRCALPDPTPGEEIDEEALFASLAQGEP